MRRSQVRGSTRHADRSIKTSVSVPSSATDRAARGQRGDGRKLEELRWETSRTPKPSTRSTIEVILKPFARARNDVDANQSS